MDQILFFACLPILLYGSYNRIVDQLPHLVLAVLVFDDLQLDLPHFRCSFYFFRWFDPLCLWTHLQEAVDTLPHEAVVLGLKQRVEVIRLARHQCAFVCYLFFLLIDVLKVLGLVLYFNCFAVKIVEHPLGFEVIEEGVRWPCQWVEKGN